MARSDWPSVVALGYVWDPLELEFVPAHQAIIDGETVNVNVDGPLDVTQSGVWNVGITGTVALPTGASTEAKQDTEIASLGSIDTTLTSQATAANQAAGNATLVSALTELQSILAKLNASLAVTGTFWQATQPVSVASMPSTPVTGPLTDAQLRAVAVPVSGTFFQGTQPVSGPLTDAELRATAVPVSGTVDIGTMPPVSASTSADVITADADAGYVDGAAGEPLTQTPDGRVRTVSAGLVADTPPSFIPGDTKALSLTTDGRVRVSSVEARVDLEFFDSDNLGTIPDMTAGRSLWDPQSAPLAL